MGTRNLQHKIIVKLYQCLRRTVCRGHWLGISESFLLILLLFFVSALANAQQAGPDKSTPVANVVRVSLASKEGVSLTSEEQQWLSQHNGRIRIGITVIPPEVLSEKGKYEGLAIDYIHLMESKLGCRFKLVPFATWDTVIQAARTHRIDMIFAAQQTPERLNYLLFTEPYIKLSNKILVRKDRQGGTNLKEMKGWSVAVSEGSAVQEYLKKQYGYLKLRPVQDELSGLMKVSIGEVDAMVVEISRASYYIEQAGISNLRVSGDAGLIYQLRFAVRNDWPVLRGILDKGLSSITDQEKQEITRRWIVIGNRSILASRVFWISFIAALGLVILALGGVIVWNRVLRRKVKERTSQLQQELVQRKLAEEALRNREAHYRSIFANSLIGVTVTDKDCIFTDANDAFCKMLEYSREELIGKMSISDVSHPDDVAKSMIMINKLIKHEIDHYALEKRYLSKTGNILPTLVYVRGHYNLEGEYEGTTASNLDITEQKVTEELLRENEEKYRTLFNNSEIAMFRSRLDGSETLEANQKFLDIVGKTREEIRGNPSTILWADLIEREEMVKRLISEGSVSDFEFKLVNRQKGARNCITSLRLYREQGILEGSVVDITERKKDEEEREKLQAQLIQSQKMESVGQLAGGVAHDFNNMLGVILGHTEMAMDQVDPTDKLYADLVEIRKAAQRSAETTRQLLTFARKQAIAPKTIDLNETVEGLLKMLRRLIGENIDLIWNPGSGLWAVKADPTQASQILTNLCVNARDAIPNIGEITVETGNSMLDDNYCSAHPGSVTGEYVRMSVRDTGTGIEDQTLTHIFEPFFTTKGVGKGTGLGLAMVYGAMKQNNGFVDVSSEPGQGSAFTVYFPRHVEINAVTLDERSKERAVPPDQTGYETILLVEDEPKVLEMTKTMLQRLGYTVLATGTPGEAIRLAREYSNQIHLLITDVIMPGMNGRSLAEQLLVGQNGMKCLFISGYTSDIIANQGILDTGVYFIQKPFSKNELATKVREVIEKGVGIITGK